MKKPSRKKPLILISNDDGVRAKGLILLAKVLKNIGRVVVVAPDQQRSAASRSITLYRPLRVNRLKRDVYETDGTPTDCVMLAVHDILTARPDIIVSGINHSGNLGEDVHYSGTVSVAFEGGILGIPSIAISTVSSNPRHLTTAANFAVKVVKKVLKEGLPCGVILNINVPDVAERDIKGYVFTTQGKRNYGGIIVEKVDPRGKKYYWIGGEDTGFEDIEHSDCNAIRDRMISITPLRVDLTDMDGLNLLSRWKL